MWDVWIHILGIGAECACWGGGRPGVPPLRSADPYRSGFWPLIRPLRGHLPPEGKVYGAHTVRPYGVFTNASTHKKRDRSGTCPLKPRGETQFRTKFLCLLSFSADCQVKCNGLWKKSSRGDFQPRHLRGRRFSLSVNKARSDGEKGTL